jgi:peptidoglycan/LPS O-acetylase OafA/YrhL
MAENVTNNEGNHLKYLDSTRGIAALMVFFSHYIARCFQDKMNVHYFFFIFNGNDAVSFFFVLSGFVLSYKYIVLNKPLDIKQFYVSRIFRLFPAYFVTVLLSAIFLYHKELNLHTAADIFIFNKFGFWDEALLIRFHNILYYPGWTLTIEFLCSFLIPFYIALAIKEKKYIPYLIVVTLIIGNNLYFSYIFLFGIIASNNYAYFSGEAFKISKWYKYRYPVLIIAIVVFSIRQIDSISPFGSTFMNLHKYLGIDFFSYTGPSCFVFLVAVLQSKRAQRFLENKVLVFLGRISYSIYLVHIIVINVLYHYLEKYITFPPHAGIFTCVTLIVIAGVIAAATAMHYLIELPFIKFGKNITRKMKPSLIIKREVIGQHAADK